MNVKEKKFDVQLYTVSVEKRLYCTGKIQVLASSPNDAVKRVDDMIGHGKLQTAEIVWSDPEYEDSSFGTTGDVD